MCVCVCVCVCMYVYVCVYIIDIMEYHSAMINTEMMPFADSCLLNCVLTWQRWT